MRLFNQTFGSINLHDVAMATSALKEIGQRLKSMSIWAEPKRPKSFSDMVVGFVDVVGSRAISRTLSSDENFHFRQKFHRLAAFRADQFDIQITYSSDDGLQFLADPIKSEKWCANLVAFCESLSSDFHELAKDRDFEFETNLRFGVSRGKVALTPRAGSHWTCPAIGPQAFHAARLCNGAASGEIVYSEHVWREMHQDVYGRKQIIRVYCDLNGFAARIDLAHPESLI